MLEGLSYHLSFRSKLLGQTWKIKIFTFSNFLLSNFVGQKILWPHFTFFVWPIIVHKMRLDFWVKLEKSRFLAFPIFYFPTFLAKKFFCLSSLLFVWAITVHKMKLQSYRTPLPPIIPNIANTVGWRVNSPPLSLCADG